MPLSPDTTLGHYRLIAPIGEGGMGVVWRAHDSTLGRDVAIKVLPDLVAHDPERLARFEREAKLLASLQHPGIAAIYGLHRAGEVRYLAMELAEGENLAQRLARGPMSQAEALRIAFAVAEALESAHERGIVHRDLKPANIMIGGDPEATDLRAGRVKLLDFGLAKAFEGDPESGSSPNLSRSPTITVAMTSAHVILGTAAYMSPEQARGQVADRRTDVWSFGVVLFEMLTGRQLFAGETISDTLASVLKTEIDWSALPGDLPPRVRTLLHRCLERDRQRRLRDIGEARIALDDELRQAPDAHLESARRSGIFDASPAKVDAQRGAPRWLPIASAALAGVLLTLGVVAALAPSRQSQVPLRKLALGNVSPGQRLSHVVVAPDGHAVAFLTPTHLVVRELRALETRQFPIEGAIEDVFWSPDGKSLGYIGRTRLFRVDAQSGQQQVVCEARGGFNPGSGAHWSDDGRIVFSQADQLGLLEVSDRGGDPKALLAADTTREGDFHDPFILPGERGILFVPHLNQDAFSTIEVWTKGKRSVVVKLPGQSLSNPVYSRTGHVLFRRSPTNPGIWAVPFSLDRLAVTGEPFLVAPGGSSPSVADDGTLVYEEGATVASLRLTWNDREGREVADAGAVAFQQGYTFPALAGDGHRACISVYDPDDSDLWIFDHTRGTRTRLTFGKGREEIPVWTPAGDAIVYIVRPAGTSAIKDMRVMRIASDGTGRPDTVAVGIIPTVSPDGRYLLYSKVLTPEEWDLGLLPLGADRASETVFLSAPRWQFDARVAPSGEYVSYSSNESGSSEIYLTRFPSAQGRWQVSVGGGQWARWNRRGDRLYYAKGDDIMEVELELGTSPSIGTPRRLFTRPTLAIPTIGGFDAGFDVTGDGQRFVFFRDPQAVAGDENEVLVVQNWFSEFTRKK